MDPKHMKMEKASQKRLLQKFGFFMLSPVS